MAEVVWLGRFAATSRNQVSAHAGAHEVQRGVAASLRAAESARSFPAGVLGASETIRMRCLKVRRLHQRKLHAARRGSAASVLPHPPELARGVIPPGHAGAFTLEGC